MRDEIAIVMAAGKGERLLPVTLTTPKPLVKVHGVPMIETVIQGLLHRGVKKIYVVIGYLGEQFAYLPEKYPEVELVENREYVSKNNISSIYAVRDVMGQANCFICEADLVISDISIFDAVLDQSCYYGIMVPGHSDDWVFDLQNGRIVRVGKSGDDTYNMCGIAYLLQKDAKMIAQAVEEAYRHPGHENLFWDEIVHQNLHKMDMRIYPIQRQQIREIDSVKELEEVDPSYRG